MTQKLHKSDWYRLIKEFKTLKLTKVEFCRIKNIELAKFKYHYYAKRDSRPNTPVMPINISPAKHTQIGDSDAVTTVNLSNGLKISIPSEILPGHDILGLIMKEVNHVAS